MNIQDDIRKAQRQELDDSELELVTGGCSHNICVWIHADNFCVADYTCFTAFFHPDDWDEENACLNDYQCITVSCGCGLFYN